VFEDVPQKEVPVQQIKQGGGKKFAVFEGEEPAAAAPVAKQGGGKKFAVFEGEEPAAAAPVAKPAGLAVNNSFLFGEPTNKSSGAPTHATTAAAPEVKQGGGKKFAVFEGEEPAAAPPVAKPAGLAVNNSFLFGEPTNKSSGAPTHASTAAVQEEMEAVVEEADVVDKIEVEEEASAQEADLVEVAVIDPYSAAHVAATENTVRHILQTAPNVIISEEEGNATIRVGSKLTVVGQPVVINWLLGKGAFAKVYSVSPPDSDDYMCCSAMKVQSSSCATEFHIAQEIQARVDAGVRRLFVSPKYLEVHPERSLLLTEQGDTETLQDVINAYLKKGKNMDEHVVAFYTIEMLRMLEHLHAVGIIHGDMKPDNLLLRNDKSSKPSGWVAPDDLHPQGLQLVDFGRSIDLNLCEENILFEGDCHCEGFKCIEMVTGKPWTFQPDIYGLLNVVHCLLHNDYMQVHMGHDDRWMPEKPFKRYWQQGLWQLLFSNLLNISDCDSIPPLRVYREAMEGYLFDSDEKERQASLQRSLHQQNMMVSSFV
jgi:checkpoint serine/threonine-protein kinase